MTTLKGNGPTGWDDSYAWPGGNSACFCFSVDVDAYAPYLWAHRDGLPNRLSHLEQRRFGPRKGLRRLVELLDRHTVKGSFFVPACIAEEHPWMLPWLTDLGHEVGLHGFYHELVGEIGDREFTRQLDASLRVFESQLGRRPGGFRSPAWEMTPHMLQELAARGLYDSSLMGSDTPYTIAGVTEVPVQWALDDAPYFKFLGGDGRNHPPAGTMQVLQSWQHEWRALHRFGGLMMLTVHDWISGRAARIDMLDSLLQEIAGTPDVWIATAGEIADHDRGQAEAGDRIDAEELLSPSDLSDRNDAS